MTNTATIDEPSTEPRRRSRSEPRLGRLLSNVELLTAILLGVVSVTTAYASFQASLYDGETAKQFSAGQSSQTEAESLYLEANQQYIRDVQLWDRMTELQIEIDNVPEQAEASQLKYDTLLFTSVSENLNRAILWSAEQNVADPSAFTSPFESEDYQNALYGAWAAEDDRSIAAFEAGDAADKRGDALTLTTVLMAISLFLLGVAAVARQLRVQLILIGVAMAIYAVSLVMTASVPFIPWW
ncbi:hypothetical protein [Naasia sp. SYSU D00948]|uniref:hypothetical protein n=1 Tax=Naasia sp. SYSU D00948 TaxID=2817379 RepID=UPI001B305B6D|nr:hypothetical protein [Naasia sp. SYSU D00948]